MIAPNEMATVQNRAAFLENEEIDLINAAQEHDSAAKVIASEINSELQKLKQRTAELKSQLAELQKSFESAVKILKQTASKADLEMADRKMSVWSPDILVTRNELKKLIENSKQ
jgi:hypothetical protein